MTIISVSSFRKSLARYLEHLHETQEVLTLTEHGVPVAMVLPAWPIRAEMGDRLSYSEYERIRNESQPVWVLDQDSADVVSEGRR